MKYVRPIPWLSFIMFTMQMTKILPTALLGIALGVAAIPAQAQRHFTPATHRSFNRQMGSKQKLAKANAKARRNQAKQRKNLRVN
jgi:hypothetical protein